MLGATLGGLCAIAQLALYRSALLLRSGWDSATLLG